MLIFSIMLFLFSFIMLFFSMYFLLLNYNLILEWNIVSLNSMKMNMFMIFNYKTLLFMFLVMFISSMIFMYSMNYMNLNNFLLKRFYYLMMLFLLSMVMLILSPNMLTIMLGWDGLGLISYCLIIYYNKLNSFNSGMMTIILNRLGDSGLLMIISFLIMFGSWNLVIYKMDNLLMFMLMIMIFTKSAQFPFYVWLPMAMMAPTPVSSLVHSSTLVTAGIYLMIWYENLFNIEYKNFILLISSMTMLISGLMANFEMDFKKIIAFSTLSQLGFMLSILCLNLNNLAFFHLFIHALFKSMMFMCVGSFIHYMNGIQNFRFYKGMFYIYPMKSMIMMFSLMMLCGFPFLVGFYSKDLMIEFYYFKKMKIFCLILLLISMLMTISYSIRIIVNLFNNKLMLNMIYLYEDKLMNFCMMFMMMIMLLLSKFIFNLNFMMINLNLLQIYKYFVIKMFILGFIMNMIFMKMNFKMILIFLKNFFFMMNMYKIIVYNFNKFLNKYEMIYEKSFYEIMFSNIMILFSMFNMKLFFNKMSLYMIILMYMYLMMIFIMF
ncbi:NADH dehydrogenase subunit 5 (mitochondrion) [Frieseomelitta varia]|uniref:NADH:ubiquinone reductase (H(+)-translocating) n=1 Tax=Frieseomelitta varia TaxID=561572 RepID=A0A833W3L0_9HYME|nr:NADH dehydrogenase subunit 5 [Frieseomelitta varia]